MTGKTIDEAHAAQEVARAAQKSSNSNSGKTHGTCGTPQPGAAAQANMSQNNSLWLDLT